MQTARRITQLAFLVLFLVLLLKTDYAGSDTIAYPVKLFLDIDPLLLVSTLLASRTVVSALLWSLVVVGFTALMGRFFCGWLCPLGTLSQYVGAAHKRRICPAAEGNWSPWQNWKFYLLIGLLSASALTLHIVGIVDPLSLLIRSFAITVLPAVDLGVRALFDALYFSDVVGISRISEPIYGFLKATILPFQHTEFQWNLLVGSIFAAILLLNLVRTRFWCRYLCPLGALLGLGSKTSVYGLEQTEACTACGRCVVACQGACNPNVVGAWKGHECLMCGNCEAVCPEAALRFRFFPAKGSRTPAFDFGRRQVLLAALSGVVAAPVLLGGARRLSFEPRLIRPPGALPERDFLERCVKCGECMKVCPTNGLQPTFLEAGLEGIWSPILVPKIGYCEYTCTLCGHVCPTGAIQPLDLETKQQVKVGLAFLDTGRCLPYAFATPCIVCEEHCPTPTKAIWLEEVTVYRRDGTPVEVQQPRVDPELCIGCGICETKCPVTDLAAIRVTSVGESRSEENQLILAPYAAASGRMGSPSQRA